MNSAPTSEQLLEQIADAFPGAGDAFSDASIEASQDPAALEGLPSFHVAMPAYMAWCVRNAHRPETLIHDHTVRALCELGRSKNPEIKHLNFKFHCSPQQIAAVVGFLRWCLNPALLHHSEHIKRSLKQWSVVTQNAAEPLQSSGRRRQAGACRS
ncbi:MAG: hypothetical protein A2W72_23390 [Burkholderiales bacterium RIFCSPLOWO2_12_67_14]|nr:MAG: hypothetical protein A2W72_23390 [Burkholderiales bacterium RIFCSPLOWO2_12_67_14]